MFWFELSWLNDVELVVVKAQKLAVTEDTI